MPASMRTKMTDAFVLSCLLMSVTSVSAGGPRDACTTCQCSPDHRYGGMKVTCSYLHLRQLPGLIPKNTTSLLLDGNDFTTTSDMMFHSLLMLRKLDLSYNKLSTLNERIFFGLRNLKELDLSSNHLPLNKSIYTEDLFSPLDQLTSLKINNNSEPYDVSSSSSYPDKSFERLESLQVLHLDGLPADFGSGFRRLVHLTNLSLSDSDGFCVLPILRNSTFRNVPHLKYLNVSNCLTFDTEHDTFSPLPNISVLDVSLNPDLGFDNFSKSTFGLRNSPLKLLKMNRLYPLRGSCARLEIKHMIHLEHTPLKEIHFEGNGIIEIEENVLTSFPKMVDTMYAGSNRFDYGAYIFEISLMNSLRHFYIPKVQGWHEANHVSQELNRGLPFHVPVNLETLDISSSYFKGEIWSTEKQNLSMKKFIARNNLLVSMEGPFKSFDKMEYLDLSHNIMTYFNLSSSQSPSLLHLNLSHNYLGNYLEKDKHGETFQGLFGLCYLDISSNGIEHLPLNTFKDLTNLTTLILSDNKVKRFDQNLGHMKHLQYVDLSFNMIDSLGKTVQIDLGSLANVTVNIAGNVLSCTCTNLEFLQWLQSYRHRFQGLESSDCEFSSGTLVKSSDLDSIVELLSGRCVSYIYHFITALSLFFVILITITASIVYRYRWRLRYMYYAGRKAKSNRDETQYKFDAFVSYADEDRGFVKEEMIRVLEKKSELKLCIHHRDFIPGVEIASNIINGIDESRKTVIILSEDFLKSSWCRYEFNMAHFVEVSRTKNVIVAIMYRRVSSQNMNCIMARFLAQYSYIEFDPAGDTDLFWSNLVDAINTDEPHG